jgi:hypothetical protein
MSAQASPRTVLSDRSWGSSATAGRTAKTGRPPSKPIAFLGAQDMPALVLFLGNPTLTFRSTQARKKGRYIAVEITLL